MARKPTMNGAQVWARVVILVAGLIGVVYTMKGIRQNSAMDSFFTPNSTDVKIKSGRLNLCPTRVGRIEITDHRTNKKLRYHQSKAQWIVEGSQSFELEPLFIEKWLGEFCEVKIDKFLTESDSQGVDQDILFVYIDGSSKQIRVHKQSFTTEYGLIESEELARAMTRLNP